VHKPTIWQPGSDLQCRHSSLINHFWTIQSHCASFPCKCPCGKWQTMHCTDWQGLSSAHRLSWRWSVVASLSWRCHFSMADGTRLIKEHNSNIINNEIKLTRIINWPDREIETLTLTPVNFQHTIRNVKAINNKCTAQASSKHVQGGPKTPDCFWELVTLQQLGVNMIWYDKSFVSKFCLEKSTKLRCHWN